MHKARFSHYQIKQTRHVIAISDMTVKIIAVLGHHAIKARTQNKKNLYLAALKKLFKDIPGIIVVHVAHTYNYGTS
jgi:hypothetical protein